MCISTGGVGWCGPVSVQWSGHTDLWPRSSQQAAQSTRRCIGFSTPQRLRSLLASPADSSVSRLRGLLDLFAYCSRSTHACPPALASPQATVSEQSEALSGLKEELAARRSDVGHLQAMAKELRAAGEAARAQAAANQEALAAAQATLQHVRGEK